MRRIAAVVVAALLGATTGAASVLLHHAWWWLAAVLLAGVVGVSWLRRRTSRLALTLAAGAVVVRAAVPRPEGDHLLAADAAGWTLLAGSLALLLVALVLPDRVDDQGREHLPT